MTGRGSTEAGPISLYWHSHVAPAGNIGLLVPGVTLKPPPTDGKLEARVQSLSVTPGYWRGNDLTSGVFDDEGFLSTGDALDWVDAGNWQSGFRWPVDQRPESRHLYEKVGFRVTKRCRDHPYTVPRDNLKMQLLLVRE